MSSKDIIRVVDFEVSDFVQTFQNTVGVKIVDFMVSKRNDDLIIKAFENGKIEFFDTKRNL